MSEITDAASSIGDSTSALYHTLLDGIDKLVPDLWAGIENLFESPGDAVKEAQEFAWGQLTGFPDDLRASANPTKQTKAAKDSGTTLADDIKNNAKKQLAKSLASIAVYLDRKQTLLASVLTDLDTMVSIISAGTFGPNLTAAAKHLGVAVHDMNAILSRLMVVSLPMAEFGAANSGFDHNRYDHAKASVSAAIADLLYDLTRLKQLWMDIKNKLKRLMEVDASISVEASVAVNIVNVPLLLFIRSQIEASRMRLILNNTSVMLNRFVVAETERQKLVIIRSLMDVAVIESQDADIAYSAQTHRGSSSTLYIDIDALSENMASLGTVFPAQLDSVIEDTRKIYYESSPTDIAVCALTIDSTSTPAMSDATVNLDNIVCEQELFDRRPIGRACDVC